MRGDLLHDDIAAMALRRQSSLPGPKLRRINGASPNLY
jgi:hypothetical protein